MREIFYDGVGRTTAIGQWSFAGTPPKADSQGLVAYTYISWDDSAGRVKTVDPRDASPSRIAMVWAA